VICVGAVEAAEARIEERRFGDGLVGESGEVALHHGTGHATVRSVTIAHAMAALAHAGTFGAARGRRSGEPRTVHLPYIRDAEAVREKMRGLVEARRDAKRVRYLDAE
jgi:hypothetical protein